LRTTQRRLTVVTLGLAVALTAAAGPATAGPALPAAPAPHAASSAPAWSQTDSNAAASRANHHETTLTGNTAAGLVIQRGFPAPAGPVGCGAVGNSAPVLTSAHLIKVANGVLSSYSVATSTLLWSATLDATDSTIYNAVAVAGGVVVVGGEDCGSQSDPNGIEQAFDETTGAPLWHTNTSPAGGALERLVVSGGLVVATGNSVGSGSIVSAHDLLTGAVVWFGVFEDCGLSGNVAVVAGEVVYSHCDADGADPVLEADDLTTGTPDWSRSGVWSVERGDTDAATSAHLLAVGPRGTLVDLVPQTGATQGAVTGAGHALVVGTKRVYATCGTWHVCAYALDTHEQLWSVADTSTLAAEAGGVLYLADGKLLRVKAGSLIATVGRLSHSKGLVVGNGRMARTYNDGSLVLYGLPGA
jgi:outer membrane protein assembly factor BamB